MGVGLQRIGLHPHPRSSRRVNIIFTFWSRTPHISFVVYFSASFLFLSLSHVLSFVALFITTSIIDKKKPNIRSSRFFFFIYLKSIEQQQLLSIQTTQCMSLSTTIINLGDFYQKKPTLSVMSKVSIFR